MLIKICGLTRQEDAEVAIAAGADFVGFIFVPGTPRAVEAESAGWIRGLGTSTVGVFRDAPMATIVEIRERLALDWVQLHGDEPDEFIEQLGPRVIRRVKPEPQIDWERVRWLGERCVPLIDPGAGDGQICDWQSLGQPAEAVDFGLAGGLTADNVAQAVRIVRPYLVDTSSGVESSPGVKNHRLVHRFVERASY